MAKPTGEREQPDTRRGAILTDEHGREYHAELSKDTLMPASIPTPVNFRQPYPTPSKYINPVKDRPMTLRTDYKQWKRDILAANNAYEAKMVRLAKKNYGNGFAKMLEDPPGELLRELGAGPMPIEFVLALEAGKSPWALGLRRKDGSYYPKPSWVTPHLEARLRDATNTVWSEFGRGDAELPVAGRGEYGSFEDEVVDDPEPVMAFADEPEELDESEAPTWPDLKPMDAPGADFGRGAAATMVIPVAPVKRGPGRPRKN